MNPHNRSPQDRAAPRSRAIGKPPEPPEPGDLPPRLKAPPAPETSPEAKLCSNYTTMADWLSIIDAVVSKDVEYNAEYDVILTRWHPLWYNKDGTETANTRAMRGLMATVNITYDESGRVVDEGDGHHDSGSAVATRQKGNAGQTRQTRKAEQDIISIKEFAKLIPDEKKAIAFFEEKRWGDTPTCPRCGSESVYRVKSGKPMSHRCRPCRKYFSVRIGTLMEETNLPVRDWLLAIYYMHTSRKGVSSVQLSKMLGVTQPTAWFLMHRIREAMQQGDLMVGGVVEVDETFLGGSDKNRHSWQKPEGTTWRDRRLMVFGAKQRNGSVVASVVWGGVSEDLLDAVRRSVIPGSMVMSDGEAAYRFLPRFGYGHDWVNHSAGEYVRDQASTNGIESFWALLKRGYMGTFHVMSWKHAFRYVYEFAFRHNAGPGNGFRTIGGVLKEMVGKRLTYRVLTADTGLPSEAR